MAVSFTVNPGSSVPIYRQIVEQARHAVATGKLTVDEQLPSVRALAEALVVNPNTVARAYSDLAREGLIDTRPGRGVFIIPKRKVLHREEGRRRLDALITSLIGEAMAMDFKPEELQEAFQRKLVQWKHEKGESG